MDSLSTLFNILITMFAIFFIFSIIAVRLYGTVDLSPGGLTEKANFQTFPVAMLTLFRMSTTDAWHEIENGVLARDSNWCVLCTPGKRVVCLLDIQGC